ncbi:hypothetical protein [Dyella sp. 20L07]|uniref:hypothetical protein n=1 Tax=Dyella sp. 20L07 TaxID=3384240 RepID=UPI003D283096
MATYKNAGDWARRQQELSTRTRHLDLQLKTGSITAAQATQQSQQLALDQQAHTQNTELLGNILRDRRLEREAEKERQARVNEIAAMLDREDAAANARIGGVDDRNDWRLLQSLEATQFLGPITSIPPLTQLMVKGYALEQFDRPERQTFAWMEAPWNGSRVRQILIRLSARADDALTQWLRTQPKGTEIAARILGEREPAKWAADSRAWAGKSYILAVVGFMANVKVGDVVEAEVIHGDRDATHAIHITPIGEAVEIAIAHKGGNGTVKGFFSGLKNLRGTRFHARVARMNLVHPRLIEIEWAFAPGATFR